MSGNTDETSQYPRTYLKASASAHRILEARKRYDELAQRDLSARTLAMLRENGDFDPDRFGHQEMARSKPLTDGEHLEMLAAGEVMARYYSHPITVHRAAEAGASFEEIAAARGTKPELERAKYVVWATAQHDMHAGLGPWEGDPRPHWGLTDEEYAKAMARTIESSPERMLTRSPGPDLAVAYLDDADPEAGL